MSINRRLKMGGLILFSAVLLSACAGNVSVEDLQGLGFSPEEIESILSGVVEELEDGKLMIDGNIIEISDETEFKGEIEVGDEVEIKFRFDEEGGMIAQSIEFHSDDDEDDAEVEFVGVVESMGSDAWVIGGHTVIVTSSTEIKDDISEGDSVKVHASPDDDGMLVAREIEPTRDEHDGDDEADLEDDNHEDEMEMLGVVESVEGGVWTIDGKAFLTLPGTEFEGDVSVGELVKVHFSIDEDGSLVAREIDAVDDDLDDDEYKDDDDDIYEDDDDDDDHDDDDDDHDDDDDDHDDDDDDHDDDDDDDEDNS